MNCSQARRELELMRQQNSSALLGHLRRCADCRDCAEEIRVRRLLRSMPAPEPGEDFENRVLKAALPQRAQPTRTVLRGWQLATAASLLLAVLAALPRWVGQPEPMQVVEAGIAAALPVSVSLDTSRALQGAVIRVSLPENLQLDGYGDTRELQWRADLSAGSNRLTLPVRPRNPANAAEILIQVEHGGARREFRVPVSLPGGSDGSDGADKEVRGPQLI